MADEHIPFKVSESFAIGVLIDILHEKELINDATKKAVQEKLRQEEIAYLTKTDISDTIEKKGGIHYDEQ